MPQPPPTVSEQLWDGVRDQGRAESAGLLGGLRAALSMIRTMIGIPIRGGVGGS